MSPDPFVDDQAAARKVREQVDVVGGRLSVAARTLMALFSATQLDANEAARIKTALSAQGVRSDPQLTGLKPDAQVTLLATATERRAPDEQPEPPPTASPTPSPAETLAGYASELSPAAAASGVLVPGLIAAALGFASWWVFGLLFLAVTGGGWWLVRRSLFRLTRVFWFPLRSALWTAFAIGLAPMLIALAVLSIFVVSPVSAKRSSDERNREAKTLIAHADDAVDRGDARGALGLLDEARRKHAEADGYRETKRRADALAAEQHQERENREAYREARQYVANGDYERAASAFADLGDYRDSAVQGDRAVALGAKELRQQSRAALGRRDWQVAIDLARQSLDLRPTSLATELVETGERQKSAAKARARARARARAAARRAAEARRAAARRDARAQREQREAQELQALQDSYDAPEPDSGGSSGNWCGATRDGDGDGVWCEGR